MWVTTSDGEASGVAGDTGPQPQEFVMHDIDVIRAEVAQRSAEVHRAVAAVHQDREVASARSTGWMSRRLRPSLRRLHLS